MWAVVEGPCHSSLNLFPHSWGSGAGRGALRGCRGHSQASFPSKLERAMAKACRAHNGYR
jgi:hypothetical protein